MAGKATVKSENSASDELLADVRRLGFTEYEARIYMQLLRQEVPATAYELSKHTGVPRPNTYSALENLSQRGAVLPVSEQPARYVATPPDELTGTIARQTAALCANLATRLAALAAPAEDRYVWTLSGDEAVHGRIDQVIDASQDILMIKAPDDILRTHVEALRRAGDRAVEMLIVVFGRDPEEFRFGPRCRTFIHEGNGVRMGSTDNLFTITSDHREVVTARIVETPQAVHSRNPAIVNMAESLIRHDYYMAEIFLKFGPQIDEAFGPFLRDLRLGCFTPEQAESFKAKTGL